MKKTWFVSDPHFGHQGMLNFKRADGTPLRDFSSTEEMDQAIIDNWNRVVDTEDKVYVMGDVAMGRQHIKTIGKCAGKKILIKGNHDIFKLEEYTPYFSDIRAYKIYPGHNLVVSHIPVMMEGRWKYNAHGHLHANVVPDSRYINLCLEVNDYTPVSFDQLVAEMERRDGLLL